MPATFATQVAEGGGTPRSQEPRRHVDRQCAGTPQLSSGSGHMNEDEAQLLSLMILERLETMGPHQPVDATPIVRDIRSRPPFDDMSEDEVRAALLRHCETLGRVCQ